MSGPEYRRQPTGHFVGLGGTNDLRFQFAISAFCSSHTRAKARLGRTALRQKQNLASSVVGFAM